MPRELSFHIPATEETETLRNPSGTDQLCITRQQALEGCIEISADEVRPQLYKLRVRVKNLMQFPKTGNATRDEALLHSFVSTHTVLNIEGGEFVSLLDPPEDLRKIAAASENIGCWPVLVGEAGERDCMLSAPIILYDYPQVASESAGDFYDSTEIDELLTLRVLTLTEEEKEEMRTGDTRARQVLERTEALPWEHLARVHGAVRGLAPVKDESLD
jgi:hydrogenase maturation protease